MSDGTKIKKLVEGTYRKVQPEVMDFLEGLERRFGEQKARQVLDTMNRDYGVTPGSEHFMPTFDRVADRFGVKAKDLTAPKGRPDTIDVDYKVVGERLTTPYSKSQDPNFTRPVPDDKALVPGQQNFTLGGRKPDDLGVDFPTGTELTPIKGRGPYTKYPGTGSLPNAAAGAELPAAPIKDSSKLKKFLTGGAVAGGAAAGGAALLSGDSEDQAAGAPAAAVASGGGGEGSKLVEAAKTESPKTAIAGMIKTFSEPVPNKKDFGADKAPDFAGSDSQRASVADEREAARQEYVASLNDLAAEYRAEKDALKRREIFEGIVNAIGYLFAGYVGQRDNLNLGGLELPRTDFAGKQAAAAADYKAMTADAATRYQARRETLEAKGRDIDALDARAQQTFQNNSKLWEQALGQWQAKAENFYKGQAQQLQERELGLRAQSIKDQGDYYRGLISKAREQEGGSSEKLIRETRAKLLDELGKATGAPSSDKALGPMGEAANLNRQYEQLTGRPLIEHKMFNPGEDPKDALFAAQRAAQQVGAAAAPSPTGTVAYKWSNGQTYYLTPAQAKQVEGDPAWQRQ